MPFIARFLNFFRQRTWIVVLFGYVLLALVLTFPLVIHFSTHTPSFSGVADSKYFLWQFWWTKTALIDHLHPLFETNWLFYPNGVDLRVGYEGVLVILASLPLQYFSSNLVVVYNLLALSSLVAAAFSAYLLVCYVTHDRGASFLSGIVYGFSCFMLTRILFGHLNFLASACLPLFTLFFLRVIRERQLRWTIALALSVFLVGLSSWFYLVGMFLLIGFFFIWFLMRDRAVLSWKSLKYLGLGLLFGGVMLVPFLWPSFMGLRVHPLNPTSPQLVIEESLDLLSPFLPAPWATFGGATFRGLQFHISTYGIEEVVFVGVVEFSALMYLLMQRRRFFTGFSRTMDVWWWLLVVFFVLSLGPVLQVAGARTVIPLPFSALSHLPGFSLIGSPARLFIFCSLAISVLTGTVFSALLRSGGSLRRMRIIFTLLAALIIIERASFPYRLEDLRTPEFFQTIKTSFPKNSAVLPIPLQVSAERGAFAEFDYYQTIIQHPILGGYVNHNAYRGTAYVLQNPWLTRLDCTSVESPTVPSSSELRTYLEAAAVDVIVVQSRLLEHCSLIARQTAQQLLDGVEPIYRDDTFIVYRTIDLGR